MRLGRPGDIRGFQRMIPTDFGDFLTVHLATPLGKNFTLSNIFVDQIPVKRMAF